MTARSLAWRLAVASLSLLLSSNLGALAQTPTQTFTPAATCTNGLPTPAASNGTYVDAFGANWAVQCAQDSTGYSYDQYEGTNGHGIYACFLGCDNRPGCTAFMYTGTVSGPNTGSGKCYYKFSSGTYYSNSTVYASGNLISNGTPNKPCPYYNQTTYTDTNGNVYQVYCGFDISGGTAISGTYRSDGMASCMTTCDSTSGCTSFSYTYTGAEPLEGAQNTDGTCFLRSGTATVNSNPNPTVGAAIRVGSTSVSQASTSTTSSTSTPAASACNLAPSPSAPSCPTANGLMFTDPCGTNYTVYCGNDTSPGAASQGSASSITACMQLCDNYSGCVAATFGGGTCYLKTSFTAVTTTSNSALVALVRYIPPNPNYAVPPLAPCQNCSSGCGAALPAGITVNAASSVLINFNNPSDGLLRNYTIHIPQYYDVNHASPLILAFHGNGDTAANIETQTGMSQASLNPYGIAVYVNGYGKGYESNPAWAPGGTYSYVDDIGFIKNLIANLTQTYCIDTGRIFAVGHSNGGGFTNVMACDPVLSVQVAAFAANSGAFYTNFTTGNPATIEPVNTPVQPLCSPGRNIVPFVEFHGTSDTQILYNGDTTHNGRILPSLPHWTTAWSTREGYGTGNYSTVPASNVVEYQFGGYSGQLGIITHYMLTGWVHQWASVASGAPIDASPIIMDFFYRWSDPNRASLNAPASSSSSSSIASTSTSSSSSSSASSTVSTTSTSLSSSSLSSSSSSSSSSSASSSSSLASSSSSSSSSSLSSSSSSMSSSRASSSSSNSVASTVSTASPITSPQSTSSQSTSSQISSTSTSGSARPTLSCPSANGQMFTDSAGIQYIVGCGADTTNGNYDVYSVDATGSFNDCFAMCSSNYHSSSTNCTAFTWAGNFASGAGPGSCFFKNISPESFQSSDSLHIGVIRMQNYVPGSYIPGASSAAMTTTMTSASSSTSSAPSISSTTRGSSASSSAMGQTTSGSSMISSTSVGQSASTSASQTSSMSSSSSILQSSSMSSSSSTASPTASCVNGPVTDTNNNSYMIECDSDTSGGSFSSQIFNSGSYTQCMPACDSTSGCTGWTWTPYELGGGICYFKAGQLSFAVGNTGYVGGILVGSNSATTTSSTSSQMGGQSTASSATTASSPSGSSSTAVALCPGSNGQTITDSSGVQYQIACSSDTSGGNYNVYNVQNGVSDCFMYCDMSEPMDSMQCTAFTFAGSVNGVGPGQCFVKSGSGTTFQASDNSHVAAIRVSASGSSTSSSSAGGATTSMSGTSNQGTTAFMSMSSSGSSPSPSAAVCQNNTQMTDTNGKTYTIYCDADTNNAGGGAFAQQMFESGDFTSCETACDTTDGCGAFVWTPYPTSGGVCYLKQLPQGATAGTSGYIVGILLSGQSSSSASSSHATSLPGGTPTGSSSPGSSVPMSTALSMQSIMTSSSPSSSPTPSGPQCPAGNGTTYTDPNGVKYVVLCDTNTDPGAVDSAAEPDLASCIDACSIKTAPSCVAVTYTGGTCYFKSQYQGSSSSPGIEAAVLMSMLGGSSSATSSSGQSSMTTSNPTSSGGSTSLTHIGGSSSSAGSSSSSSMSSGGMMSQSSSGMSPSNSGAGTSTSSMVSMSSPAASSAVSTTVSGVISTGESNSPSSAAATSSTGTMVSMSMSGESPTTTPMSESSSQSLATSAEGSSTSSLSACPTQTTGPQPSNGSACADDYGNPFNVTYGKVYSGTITMRAVKPNLGACLTLCDTTPGCQAVNYIGNECQVLTDVTGSTTAPGAAAAATRPADVTTVYTAPPTSTTSTMAATSAPASNEASVTMTSAGGGTSTGMETSNGGSPGSSDGQSMPGMTSASTVMSPTLSSYSQPTGGSSSQNGQGSTAPNSSSGKSNGQTGTAIGGTTHMSTNGNVPTTEVTMANPSHTTSSGMSGGPSGGGGPGLVSGGNSGIVSGMTSQSSGGSSQGPSGSINTNTNTNTHMGSVSATATSSRPASTGPVCPNYDGEHYTDAEGGTYNIRCNTTLIGSVISSTDSPSAMRKRQPAKWTAQSCLAACDENSDCVAIVMSCLGTCTLLASVDSTAPSSMCGFSARKVGSLNGGNDVVTVTVCAAQRTRTTTVLTTATLRTCPANAHCTAGGGRWLANGDG